MRFTAVVNLPVIVLVLAVGAAAAPINFPLAEGGPSHIFLNPLRHSNNFYCCLNNSSIKVLVVISPTIPLILEMHQVTAPPERRKQAPVRGVKSLA
jgi:hypothetical protein